MNGSSKEKSPIVFSKLGFIIASSLCFSLPMTTCAVLFLSGLILFGSPMTVWALLLLIPFVGFPLFVVGLIYGNVLLILRAKWDYAAHSDRIAFWAVMGCLAAIFSDAIVWKLYSIWGPLPHTYVINPFLLFTPILGAILAPWMIHRLKSKTMGARQ